MNQIYVKGGTKDQKMLITHVAQFCINRLLPRFRTLDLNFHLWKGDDYADGYMWQGDNNRQYFIQIDKNVTLRQIIRTVCHEMVHVKQYVRGETDVASRKWKSKTISATTEYYDLPWEKEAFRLQDELACEYLLTDVDY